MSCATTISAPSRIIARHVARLSFADLPDSTVHSTRRSLLDSIGVMLGATGLSPECLPFKELALNQQSDGSSRLFGSSRRSHPEAAASANGALAHALDFGDVFDLGPAHPNAALVPALLALADARAPVSADRFLTAMAAGSDFACRLSLSPARRFEEGGWYPPPLVGMLGAAAGSAKLLGLDEDGILAALGLVLCQASFPGQIKHDSLTQVRAIREAFAARAAVSAALLAEQGVRGFEQPLEGKAGFFAIYGGGLDADMLLGDLGKRFLGDELTFKPWPCCRGTHAYIEAALELKKRVGDPLADIEVLEAEIGPVQAMLIEPLAQKIAPASAIDAKFSIPFTVATALAEGSVTLGSFGTEARSNPRLLTLARKVRSRRSSNENFSPAAGSLAVTLATKEQLLIDVPEARGSPSRPLSDAELVAKFIDCGSRAATPLDHLALEDLATTILSLAPGDSIEDLSFQPTARRK